MVDSVRASTDPRTPFMTMFLLLFGETLASFLGILVTIFFGFHIWLMLKSMTTIEFCEKSMKRTAYDSSAYDRGTVGNIKAVLGENVLLWLLPCSTPAGRGLSFVTEDTPLTKDMEAGRSRRKQDALAPGDLAYGMRRRTRDGDDEAFVSTRHGERPQSCKGGTASAPISVQQSEDEDDTSSELPSPSDQEGELHHSTPQLQSPQSPPGSPLFKG